MRVLVLTLFLAVPAFAARDPRVACMKTSGAAATQCLASAEHEKEIEETPHPEEPAPIDEATIRKACDEETSIALGYLGADDTVLRLSDACNDFAADAVDLVKTEPEPPLGSSQARCQAAVDGVLDVFRIKIVNLFAKTCYLREAKGGTCHHAARDRKAQGLRKKATARIVKGCGSALVAMQYGSAEVVVATAFDRARHFAQWAYPPNDLGPSAELGTFPVGTRTIDLVDDSRPNVKGTGSRPVKVELWYPSTAAAVAGMDRYIVTLGVDIARTPTYRDVAIAPGPFPLVLFSHGNAGIRFQSIFLAAQLASHGYIVASPDHYGNTFLDIGQGIVDPLESSAINRPLDMTFLLNELTTKNATPGDFLAGAIDLDKVGMSGHSFGGYTTFALAGGTFAGQTFTDARMKAFLPLAPAASLFPDAFFATITKPILVVGGTLDTTTPFPAEQQHPFDLLPAGAPIVGLAEIAGAGHFTFSDVCEVPRDLVGAIGGFDEACTPRHLPWRNAHDIVNYLAENFFDAALKGDVEAMGRLAPSTLASIDDLVYQKK